MKLHFESSGDGENTLVWIHGMGGDTKIFSQSIPEFGDFTNVAFDYLGHGASSQDTQPSRWIEDTIKLALERLRGSLKGKIIWISHSFGGNLISELAPHFDQTAGIIFVDSTCYITEETLGARQILAEQWLATSDPSQTLKDFYSEVLIGPNANKSARQLVMDSLGRCNLLGLIEMYRTFKTPPRPPKNQSLPALILEAGHYSACDQDKSFIQLYPNATREIREKDYHFFFVEDPKGINSRIRSFVAELLV